MDFEDLATGLAGGGGGGEWRGLAHNSRALSLSTSFLRAWARGTLMCLFACFVVVVVVVVVCFVFDLFLLFRYEQLKPEPESKLWHTSRFNVRVWSQICLFILNRFIWVSITGTLPDNNTLVHFWVRSLRTRWLKYKLQSTKLGTIENSTKTYETRKMPSGNVKKTNERLDEGINNYTTTTPMIWWRHTKRRWL